MFWGQVVKPGKAQAFVPPPDGSKLHLSQAAVGGAPKAGERVSVSLVMGKESYRLITFLGGVSEAAGLDLVLDSYAEFKVEGKQEVHLTGYLMPEFDDEVDDDDMGDDDDDDDDSDSDDGEMAEDGLLTAKEEAAMRKLLGGQSSVKIEELEADEENIKGVKTKIKVVEPEDEDEDEDEDSGESDGEEEEGEEGGEEEEEEEESDEEGEEEGEEEEEESDEEEEEEEKPAPPAKKAKTEAKPAPATTKPKAETISKAATPAKAAAGKKNVKQFENGFAIEYVGSGQADGAIAKPGKRCAMRYVGRLKSTGKVFDQTKGRATFAFRLGVGEVIKGWDKGVLGMRVGDKRKLTVPPQMAYGASGVRGAIPPNATLEFDVELVSVK
eukprot:jgi/Tetstr1/431735/TSEL_002225.t1